MNLKQVRTCDSSGIKVSDSSRSDFVAEMKKYLSNVGVDDFSVWDKEGHGESVLVGMAVGDFNDEIWSDLGEMAKKYNYREQLDDSRSVYIIYLPNLIR